MRSTALMAAAVVFGLLVLAFLPISYAQSPFPKNQYLPFVFKPAAPAATTSPTITVTNTPDPNATQTPTPSNTVTPSGTIATATPTATSATGGFPPVGAGTPTRTPYPVNRPIVTNGQDLWNCTDFGTWADSNVVFQANRPGDPNRLDQDGDGIPCETLPGAPPS